MCEFMDKETKAKCINLAFLVELGKITPQKIIDLIEREELDILIDFWNSGDKLTKKTAQMVLTQLDINHLEKCFKMRSYKKKG